MQQRGRGLTDHGLHRPRVDNKGLIRVFDMQSLDRCGCTLHLLILQKVLRIFLQPGADQDPAHGPVFLIPRGGYFKLCGDRRTLRRDQAQLLRVIDRVVRKGNAKGDRGVGQMIIVGPVDDDGNPRGHWRCLPKLRGPARIRLKLRFRSALIQAEEADIVPVRDSDVGIGGDQFYGQGHRTLGSMRLDHDVIPLSVIDDRLDCIDALVDIRLPGITALSETLDEAALRIPEFKIDAGACADAFFKEDISRRRIKDVRCGLDALTAQLHRGRRVIIDQPHAECSFRGRLFAQSDVAALRTTHDRLRPARDQPALFRQLKTGIGQTDPLPVEARCIGCRTQGHGEKDQQPEHDPFSHMPYLPFEVCSRLNEGSLKPMHGRLNITLDESLKSGDTNVCRSGLL